MNDYTFTLTATSVKKVNVTADSLEEAGLLIQQIISHSDALDFGQNDVVQIDIIGEPAEPADSDENDCCTDCIYFCDECGSCICSD